MYKTKYLKKTVVVLLTIWTLIAVARIPIYITKAWKSSSNFENLSNDEKKHQVYGKVYNLYLLVNRILPDKNTALYMKKDSWEFFLLRYLLYPKRIISLDHPDYTGSVSDYSYIIVDEKTRVTEKNAVIIEIPN